MRNPIPKFSRETRELIVLEYLNGEMTQKELCRKYGINCRSTLANWVFQYDKSKKSLSLQPEPQKVDTIMVTIEDDGKSKEELLELLKKKEFELQKKTMEVAALNKLIDIAERNGISIRKNSGAKR